MPLYEFACEACDSKFERLLSFQSASGGVACPACGRGEARRLISTFAALSKSGTGETSSIAGAGGGCACSTGGGCGCGCGH
jgi:putative FmdB family regulatory protein